MLAYDTHLFALALRRFRRRFADKTPFLLLDIHSTNLSDTV